MFFNNKFIRIFIIFFFFFIASFDSTSHFAEWIQTERAISVPSRPVSPPPLQIFHRFSPFFSIAATSNDKRLIREIFFQWSTCAKKKKKVRKIVWPKLVSVFFFSSASFFAAKLAWTFFFLFHSVYRRKEEAF